MFSRRWILGQPHSTRTSHYALLVQGTANDEHVQRKEFILNTLFVWSIPISFIAIIYGGISFLLIGRFHQENIVSHVVVPTIVFITTLFLYWLSKKGLSIVSRVMFPSLIAISGIYTCVIWGANTPQGLLSLGIAILFFGILVSAKAGAISTLVVGIMLFSIHHGHISHLLPLYSWKNVQTRYLDILVYVCMFLLMTIVSWLSNRELEHLLTKTKRHARQLKLERDSLEVKVQERTYSLQRAYEELQKIEKEKYVQVQKLITLGKFSTGLIHDIVNPLTYTSASLELALSKRGKNITKTTMQKRIKTALRGTFQIAKLIQSAREGLKHQRKAEKFSIKNLINETLLFLEYKAKTSRVEMKTILPFDKSILGDRGKFHQCIVNLVVNAIESYENIDRKTQRVVVIRTSQTTTAIRIHVQDFGSGISKHDTGKIFDLFYTTKENGKSMGVGLALCKEIIETQFKGALTCRSLVNKGTVFTITLPKHFSMPRKKNGKTQVISK